jgi:hypothetical protein
VRAIQPLLERQAKQRAKTLADDEFSFPFGAADERGRVVRFGEILTPSQRHLDSISADQPSAWFRGSRITVPVTMPVSVDACSQPSSAVSPVSRLCKPEVTGSIPVRSIQKPAGDGRVSLYTALADLG